ncbi:MAG TPA: AraC family transcriptional regulator [Terricaulis sp.]|nr:AraC family transcriptional regulator [Terricaulis sp.]
MDRQAELVALIDKHSTEGMHPSAIPRLSLIRATAPSEPIHTLYDASLCLVVQGKKQVQLGERVLEYDSGTFLAVSVDMAVVGRVIEASRERPYLCFALTLDRAAVAALALEMGPPPAGEPGPGMALGPMNADLLDAALRLVRLLETPRDIPVLAPMAERELLYRLLAGPNGARLRQIAHAESKLSQVSRAISWIKHNYREAFSIEALAAEARMSASALHLHFKQVTALSPLQYQKQIRLHEARRLILSTAMDAASAAHEVGYDSPSQFSREYRRLFGAPPLRDAARLREAGLAAP